MKLVAAQIHNFRSIEDSKEFQIGDLTCLVGKNEAGKTAILQALLGLMPFGEYAYEKMRDYPRRHVSKYNERHKNGESEVVVSTWELSNEDKRAVSSDFGDDIFRSDRIKITSHIGKNKTWTMDIDDKKCLENLIKRIGIQENEIEGIQITTSKSVHDSLNALPQKTEKQNELINVIQKFRDKSSRLHIIDILQKRMPKFFYTSHFERMSGEISVEKLERDKKNNTLCDGDKIFLNFLEYAGTSVDDLKNTTKYEELKAQCEGASNEITDEIFEFWSQNESLSVQIDFSEGKPEDTPPFNSGTIVKIRIYNSNHRVTVPLSERSAGFIWFFSFLSQFKQLKKDTGNAILLLDEPGLTLHGKAQSDLLRYIQERLLPEHQIIYTTHSPFMIPAERLADVRVVEDLVEYDDRHKATVKGTKVSSDVLSVDKDTIFPLQGHLGYEITQTLFIGKNTLLVEGPSDILYIQSVSNALKKCKRAGLSPKWTICPSGGIDKILSFASLF
jgi:predicted ATP-dependent endonuclease of OLD family